MYSFCNMNPEIEVVIDCDKCGKLVELGEDGLYYDDMKHEGCGGNVKVRIVPSKFAGTDWHKGASEPPSQWNY